MAGDRLVEDEGLKVGGFLAGGSRGPRPGDHLRSVNDHSAEVAIAVEVGLGDWRRWGVSPGRNWVTRRPCGTRDYRNGLPKWTYILSCGHSTRLSRRVAHDLDTGGLDGWVWCPECGRWLFADGSSTVEVAPSARRVVRHLRDGRVIKCRPHVYTEGEVALLEDEAILKNRIAAEVDRRWRSKAEFDPVGFCHPVPHRSGRIRFTPAEIQEIAAAFDADLAALYRPDAPGAPSLGFRRRTPTVNLVRRILLDHGYGNQRPCREKACGEPVFAKGLCDAHYRAAERARLALPKPTPRTPPSHLDRWPVSQITPVRTAS